MRADPGWRTLLCAGLLSGCLSEQGFPGDEVMGTFDFSADPLLPFDCGLQDLPEQAVSFSATFSRDAGQREIAYTLGGVSSGALFDGQVVEAARSAVRRFPPCECGDRTTLKETLRVALLSKSQDSELLGKCPVHPLDGGVPAADGGVMLPESTPRGFDAVRACGELVNEILEEPGAGCSPACSGCTLRYRVTGVRR